MITNNTLEWLITIFLYIGLGLDTSNRLDATKDSEESNMASYWALH